jgi:poly-beta-1,6-N-acetyl-D-glucosamine synthase
MKTDSTEIGSPKIMRGQDSGLKYVVITPARNESAAIEKTIKAVVAQSVRPVVWIIVSDGSTDDTDTIVSRYAAEYSWIELVRLPERRERHFAGKVNAFTAGYARVAKLDYDVIANLDADITMDEGYFEFLLKKLSQNPRLGVAGTPFREGQRQYDYRFSSIEHVSGACQLFRRECFEEIGGYVPITIGGIDLVAVLTARMKGWQTRSFPEKCCTHHRKMGTAKRGALAASFRGGQGDYMLGMHPLWEIFRCMYQMSAPPILLGGSLRVAGFFWAIVTGVEKVVSRDLVKFRRAEQMRRLRDFIKRVFTLRLESTRDLS